MAVKICRGQTNRFLDETTLDKNDITNGDLYKRAGTCCLNIRAACHLISNRNDPDSEFDIYRWIKVKNSHFLHVLHALHGRLL